VVRQCGAHVEHARSLIELGAVVRRAGRTPAARDHAGDLTPSERRVAELAAAGRMNRQIADELYVTVQAVEGHCGNAYRKVDICGRAELPAARLERS
jgi:DNA-binding NarL/FixJ family response regulator